MTLALALVLSLAAAPAVPADAVVHGLVTEGNVLVRVEIDRARRPSVDVRAAAEARLDVDLSGSGLVVRAPSQADGPRPTITIVTDHLAEVTARGSSRVEVEGLAGRPLTVRGAGTAVVTLAGKTSSLTVEGHGTSRVDASRLAASSAEVTLADAARAEVRASFSLRCDLQRASRLVVRGKPSQVRKKVAGVATLTILP